MKLTRRELVVAAAGSALAAKASAQTSAANVAPVVAPVVAPAPDTDFAKQAQDDVLKNRSLLAAFDIPMSTEPAFQFKA